MEGKSEVNENGSSLCFFSCLMLTTAACEKEGTAEKAGKIADRAFDSAKQKLDEVTK